MSMRTTKYVASHVEDRNIKAFEEAKLVVRLKR